MTADIAGWRGRGAVALVVNLVLTAATVVGAYLYRLPCFGPTFDANGTTSGDLVAAWFGKGCYTDFQVLWGGRSLFEHLFPYVNGGTAADGSLLPGSIEYPVLSGLLTWVVALPASTDLAFYTAFALVLGVCALGVTALLVRLAGWRALWWSLAPGVFLYATYNVEMFVVLLATAGLWAAWRAAGSADRSTRWLVASGVLLGLGAAAKLYPLLFVVPVALWALLPRTRVPGETPWSGLRWRGLVAVVVPAVGVLLALNVPFMLVNVDGWMAGVRFQWTRDIDGSTNTIWYWGLRPYSDRESVQALLRTVVSAATLIGILAPVVWGVVRWWRRGEFGWLQVSAAMLMAYLLLNKVHSPQYMLWLIPFFVLLRIRWPWIVAYYVADVFTGVGFFARAAAGTASIEASVWPQIFILGVWGRAILLFVLFFVAMRARPVWAGSRQDPLAGDLGEPARRRDRHGRRVVGVRARGGGGLDAVLPVGTDGAHGGAADAERHGEHRQGAHHERRA
ncbi:MAG: hypothetical protein QM604_08470 [Microbacterium sp.]